MCEMFGCNNPGVKMYQLAPATPVWLCLGCIQTTEKEKAV